MGSMSVSSCRCCMFVSCLHPVSVLNAAFFMTCSLLINITLVIYAHIITSFITVLYNSGSAYRS